MRPATLEQFYRLPEEQYYYVLIFIYFEGVKIRRTMLEKLCIVVSGC